MISRQLSWWQKVAALAPALLVLVYLPAQVMLRCRLDGRVRAACCCSHDGDRQPAGPAMKAQDCCELRIAGGGHRPQAEVARSATRDLVPNGAVAVIVPAAPLLAAPAADRFDRAIQRHGPAAGHGPPLVVLKHAFLI